MTKIKRTSVMESALAEIEVPNIPLSDTDSVYSLPQLVSKINSKDRGFLKYLPEQMLSTEQSEPKVMTDIFVDIILVMKYNIYRLNNTINERRNYG